MQILIGLSKVPFCAHPRGRFCKVLADEVSRRHSRVEIIRIPYPGGKNDAKRTAILAAQLFTLPTTGDESVYLALDEIAALVAHPRKVAWLGDPLEAMDDLLAHGRRLPIDAMQIFATTADLSAQIFRRFGIVAPVLYPRLAMEAEESGGEEEEVPDPSDRPVVVAELGPASPRLPVLLRAIANLPHRPLLRLISDEAGGSWETQESLALLRKKGDLEVWPRLELPSALAQGSVHLFLDPSAGTGESALLSLGTGGVIVTAPDAPAVEFVRHGVEGMVVRPRTHELADALGVLLAPRGPRRRFEARARELYLQIVPSWSETLDTLLEAASSQHSARRPS